ncbi:CopG family transcriptional regulator [Flavobacterium nitrogenifigens]|uniref:CopG family transcriptional regulator n=1 Tax=Flavobacterium nitrogenifigens TaxID=1617283 RepID=UPI0031ABF236
MTAPNEEWLKNQVNSEEFSSKSEAINFLIKKARSQEEFYDFVRAKIDKGEKSGFAKKQTREEMLTEFKKGLGDV